jgi:cobalamin biosynthesis Mg chelatase CobN
VTAVVTPSIAKEWVDSTIGAFVLNSPYSDGVQAKGGGYLDGTMRGVMGYIIAPNSGALPAGISLDFKSGRLSGTPTQAGPFRFSIYAGFWSANGLSLQFSGTIGEAAPTTSVAEEEQVSDDTVVDDSVTEDTVTEDTVTEDTVTEDTVTEDTVTESETTDTTSPAVESAAEIQGQAPTEQTVTLLDVVSSDQLVAQVLPDEVTRIVCDSGCLQLLVTRVGLEKGQVFARVSSTEWKLLDGSTEAIEFPAGTDIANIQVKVVSDDGATYVMQGQVQREGIEDGSSMSSAIWWLLLVLLLLIAVAVLRERRKKLATS